MQHNLCWLYALVFSSHDAASPCSSMYFQQLLFWLVSQSLFTSLFWINTVSPSGLSDVFAACLYVRNLRVSFRQPDLQNLYIRQYRCLDKGWVFSERKHSFINPQVPVSIEENRKPKRKPEHLKLCLQHQTLHTINLGKKLKSYDPLIWNREKKMHQRTLKFRKEDTEGKQSGLKENQHKTAWLEGIQSIDSNDVTARPGHLLVSCF